MSSKHINYILMEYDKAKAAVEEDAHARVLEIYKVIPRIKAIDSELGSLGLEIARSVFNNKIDITDAIEQIKQKAIDLKMEKGELLTKNSYPLDYTAPKYYCSDCKDTGYSGSVKCHCFKQKIINWNYNQSNLKSIIEKQNFETFIFDYYSIHKFEDETSSPRRNIEEIFKASIDFVTNFETVKDNLFFYGNSGLGKTFLSNCIAKDLLDKGKLVIYQTASSLIELLKAAKFENTNDAVREKLQDIFESDLLIIDDLGTEYITDFSQMELFNIINRRLITDKKMIISTNFSLDNIFKTYPERITSRIFGSFTAYKFYGEDIRVKIAQQKRKRSKK